MLTPAHPCNDGGYNTCTSFDVFTFKNRIQKCAFAGLNRSDNRHSERVFRKLPGEVSAGFLPFAKTVIRHTGNRFGRCKQQRNITIDVQNFIFQGAVGVHSVWFDINLNYTVYV
jgi:hypothetical protein